MEEKLLKEKELKELLDLLAKLDGFVKMTPSNVLNSIEISVHLITASGNRFCYFIDDFHAFAHDPSGCILTALRGFFSHPSVEEILIEARKAS